MFKLVILCWFVSRALLVLITSQSTHYSAIPLPNGGYTCGKKARRSPERIIPPICICYPGYVKKPSDVVGCEKELFISTKMPNGTYSCGENAKESPERTLPPRCYCLEGFMKSPTEVGCIDPKDISI